MNYRAAIAFTPFIVFTLACVGQVGGERAESGCPTDEVCSPVTPSGLIFSGEAFYDEAGVVRLGPVLLGGSMDIGFNPIDAPIGEFEVVSSDPAVLTAEESTIDADVTVGSSAEIIGVSEGSAYVRVVDAKGQLFDRLSMSIYAIDHVDVNNLIDPEVDVLITGCESMMGIHLMVKDGDLDVRAIDKGIGVTANGVAAESEGGAWDCFRFVPGEGAVELEVSAGGEVFTFDYKVRPLGEGESCPERTD